MIFSIITIFPESFVSYFNTSILKRAQEKGKIKIQTINPRDFTFDKHRKVDDIPYGGGPGMVMKAEPILKAIDSMDSNFNPPACGKNSKFIILSPRGKQFTHAAARSWSAKYKSLILICGRYEGIDERVKKTLKADEISVGPYILSGGELAAMVVIEAVSRHILGVLGKKESLEEYRSDNDQVCGYPVYTRPEVVEYQGKKYRAPKVILSGNHKKIAEWRKSNRKWFT